MKQKQLLSFLVCILMLSSCAAPTDSTLDSGLTLRVYFADAEEIRLLPLEDYVFGALAAEMPANYAPEALKCQAIAARTRAVAQSRAFGGNGCVRPPGLRYLHGQRVLSGIPDGCAAARPLGQRVRRPPRAH